MVLLQEKSVLLMIFHKNTAYIMYVNTYKWRYSMSGYIKWLDGAPKWLKVVFCLPGLGLIWGLYRLFKSLRTKNVLHIVLGVVMLLLCPSVFWVVDLITVLLSGKVIWID